MSEADYEGKSLDYDKDFIRGSRVIVDLKPSVYL